MEPLPPLIRLTLRPGTVYYFVHRDLTSPEPHYFIVLCNQVFELPREELVEKIESRQIRNHRDLPAEILTRIRSGVMASPRVDEAHKRFLHGGASAGRSADCAD
jgi:hypothetical protein